jgi:hypothetical protein
MQERKITLNKIARLIEADESSIYRRSIIEKWPFAEVKGKGAAGRKKYFAIQDLPLDIRTKALQALNSVYQKNTILPQRSDLSIDEQKGLISQWNEAQSWRKREAEARLEILMAWNKFPKKGSGRKQAAVRFANEYAIHNNNIGVTPGTFQRIKSISRASLYNYHNAYRKYGLVGLLPRGKGKPGGVWTQEIEGYMQGLIGNNPDIRAIRLWDYIQNKFAGPGVSIPSKKTVRTKLRKWKKENQSAYAFAQNPDGWRSGFQLALGDASESAKYFTHMVELDSSPADVLCSDGKRNVVIGAIDRFSRKAKVLIAPTSKSTAIANLLRLIFLDWGLIDVGISDNGPEYISIDTKVICDSLGISLEPTLPFSPELKSFIERFFGSLAVGLFEELPDFIGHNQAQRKAIESRKSFAERFMQKGEVIEVGLTNPELQRYCDMWIENIYHQRTHSSLGKSPEEKAAESTKPTRKIEDPRILDLLLAPVGYPTVQKQGIQYRNSFYIAPELGDFVRQKVEIRVDLQDAGRVFVFEKDTREFICIAEDASISGLTVAEINEARNRQKKKVRQEVRALKALAKQVGNPMAELLESKRSAPGQIRAFHRTEEATSPMIEEARKAIKAQEGGLQKAEPAQGASSSNVVSFAKRPEFFLSSYERARWILDHPDQVTDEDHDWFERYRETVDYYRIFVMPYEDQQGGAR